MRRHCRGIQRSPMIGFEQNLKAQRCVLRKVGRWVRHADCCLRHGSMRVFSKTTHCLTARKHRHDTIIHHHFHHFLVRMFGLRENRMLQKKAGWVEIGNEIRPNSCHATHWIIMASTYLRARTNI